MSDLDYDDMRKAASGDWTATVELPAETLLRLLDLAERAQALEPVSAESWVEINKVCDEVVELAALRRKAGRSSMPMYVDQVAVLVGIAMLASPAAPKEEA